MQRIQQVTSNMGRAARVCVGLVCCGSLLGCGSTSGAKKSDSGVDLQNPNPMEQVFGHVLFSDSAQHYPALRPAAPKDAKTPGHNSDVAANDAPANPSAPAVADAGSARRPLIVPGSKTSRKRPSARKARKAVPDVPKKPKAPKKTPARTVEIIPAEDAKAPEAPPQKGLGDGTQRGEVLTAARRLVGVNTNFDEQGFLIHLLQVADVSVEAGEGDDIVKALYDELNQKDQVFGPSRTPEPGDLIFFSNTYDRDSDGRTDDWFTMVGVVERLDGDGTVQFIGFAGGRIDRLYMNLSRPSAERDETSEKTLNSLLRDKKLSDRPFTRYHAGELFASYGALD